ncbi:MAG: metallophosphatase family protein [Anaerolineae bacterium]|jgi:predicted phosphodiesterase|nr:metallophosphatase family protein [Anaerolineae bacterium]
MKLAVFSDVHGNLTALETVKVDIEAHQPDLIWCLGDLASHGARPAECIQTIRTWREAFGKDKFMVIGGNTDRYLVTGERFKLPPATEEEKFQKLHQARLDGDTILNWGLSKLTWDDYQFLAKRLGRETAHYVEGFGWVIGYHAIPGDDEKVVLPNAPDEEFADALLDREGRLAISAHIHQQMNRQIGRWQVVNCGSVGASFDMPSKVQWGLFTFADGAVDIQLKALPYDVDVALADAQNAGFPMMDWLANRLKGLA